MTAADDEHASHISRVYVIFDLSQVRNCIFYLTIVKFHKSTIEELCFFLFNISITS